ncbi:MAG: hypothetical protein WC314_12960 [Vulcanimicrobiota bacterium]
MKSHITNPAYFRLDMLLTLGVSQVHEFARRATATLTTYRLILGRCLLAMRESKGFKKFGCSSEIHYATAKLGMNKRAARECRRVARSLTQIYRLLLVSAVDPLSDASSFSPIWCSTWRCHACAQTGSTPSLRGVSTASDFVADDGFGCIYPN